MALSGSGNGHAAKGTITVLVRYYKEPTVTVLSGSKLRNADGYFGKSDPFAKLAGLVLFSYGCFVPRSG